MNEDAATACEIRRLIARCRRGPLSLWGELGKRSSSETSMHAHRDVPVISRRSTPAPSQTPQPLAISHQPSTISHPMSTLIVKAVTACRASCRRQQEWRCALAACLLTSEECVLTNMPRIRDVEVMAQLLVDLGAEVEGVGTTTSACAVGRSSRTSPTRLWWPIEDRCFIGPLLARRGRAHLAPPGGDFPRAVRSTHLEAGVDGRANRAWHRSSPRGAGRHATSFTA